MVEPVGTRQGEVEQDEGAASDAPDGPGLIPIPHPIRRTAGDGRLSGDPVWLR